MSEIPALEQIIEGAILAADQPLSIDLMIQLFEQDQPTRAEVRDALASITEACDGRGFELKEVATGYRFQVRTEYGEWVSRLWDERPPRYTRALLETLALIAYKQPITRGDIEEIRGVTVSTNIMRTLLEREWIRVVGHRDVPGKPAIYATTKTFLDYFNLSSLDELPTLSEIKDLDKVNEELDLDDEIIESRTLEIPVDEEAEAADTDTDTDSLADVTNKVNEIEENIKNLFRVEEAAEDAADEELNEILGGSETDAATEKEVDTESEAVAEADADADAESEDESVEKETTITEPVSNDAQPEASTVESTEAGKNDEPEDQAPSAIVAPAASDTTDDSTDSSEPAGSDEHSTRQE